MPLNGSLEASSIYITLNTRRRAGTYVGLPLTQLLRSFLPNSVADLPKHWGLTLTDPHMKAAFHHANNLLGSWEYEEKVAKPDQSGTLVVLVLVGKAKNHSRIMEVIRGIPADGSPSKRTGEFFTCRIWVKDVLVSLHERREIVLPGTIDELEKMAVKEGLQYTDLIADGRGAMVINKTPFQGATTINKPSCQVATIMNKSSCQGATVIDEHS
ncbi:hypothetical protein E4U09_006998 [Claviceps aff. purpurea]|uniref:Uncharacterized protein n=1 Tax=Claviceps aff. purpurea TaxID=1967640 RepID=A0A9P7TYB5_9HYPO|nr:hypothetical protein E4U09_006998 [Claviceps aff. purpurea]